MCFNKDGGSLPSNTLRRAANQFTLRARCAGGVVATWTNWAEPALPREWRARAALARACAEEFDVDLAALAPRLAARLASHFLAAKAPAAKKAKKGKKASKTKVEAAPSAPARASKRARAAPARLAEARPELAAKRAACKAPDAPAPAPTAAPPPVLAPVPAAGGDGGFDPLAALGLAPAGAEGDESYAEHAAAFGAGGLLAGCWELLSDGGAWGPAETDLPPADAGALPAPCSPLRAWAAEGFPAADPLAPEYAALARTDLVLKALAFSLPIPEALGA